VQTANRNKQKIKHQQRIAASALEHAARRSALTQRAGKGSVSMK